MTERERRGRDVPDRAPRRSRHVGVLAVLAAAGLLFTVSARAADGSSLRDDVADLPALVAQEAASVEAASERVSSLRQEVQTLTSSVADAEVAELQAAADALAADGGLQALEGPAVTVTLDDAPRDRPVPEGVDADLLVVHQEDVQAVVNALWAAGAEAMMLMDQRVISTSAVRCVGSTLRLQGRVYSPPYRITAIGDTGRLLRALDESADVAIYQQYVRAYGLGYSVETQRSVTVPAFDGPLEMRFAQVAREGAA